MIFYFSATGNSLYAANQLSDKATLVSINLALRDAKLEYDLSEVDTVGFIIPVYFLGLPEAVRRFIRRVKLTNYSHCYFYAILNCGSMTGNAGSILENDLQARGIELNALYSVVLPDNYVPLYPVPTPDRQADLLKQAAVELSEIRSMIADRKLGDFNKHKGMLPRLMTALLYPWYRSSRKTGGFKLDKNKCVKCRACEVNCPDRAIMFKNGYPHWAHEYCSLCLGCLHRCPQNAIQRGKSQEHGRYLNPWVKEAKKAAVQPSK